MKYSQILKNWKAYGVADETKQVAENYFERILKQEEEGNSTRCKTLFHLFCTDQGLVRSIRQLYMEVKNMLMDEGLLWKDDFPNILRMIEGMEDVAIIAMELDNPSLVYVLNAILNVAWVVFGYNDGLKLYFSQVQEKIEELNRVYIQFGMYGNIE